MFKKNTLDFRTKNQKLADLKCGVKAKWDGFAVWVRNNMDVLVFIVPVGVAVFSGATKIASKTIATHNLNKEIRFKERTIYDRSLGRFTELRRPLTAKESLIIENRRANGEKLNTILDDMRLLKRR